jgi:nitrite reductase/ring-hydroxylating ferredoxin subunit
VAPDPRRGHLNAALPPPGTRLCALADIPDPGAKGFRFRESEQLFHGFVVRASGEVRGWIDQCPHAGLPLAFTPDRYLTQSGDQILCASHGALFRLDGVCVAGPCAGKQLSPWPVRVELEHVVTG